MCNWIKHPVKNLPRPTQIMGKDVVCKTMVKDKRGKENHRGMKL